MLCIASYVIGPLHFSRVVSISILRHCCISGLMASSSRQKLRAVDDVSNPAAKKRNACDAIKESVNSTNETNAK